MMMIVMLILWTTIKLTVKVHQPMNIYWKHKLEGFVLKKNPSIITVIIKLSFIMGQNN